MDLSVLWLNVSSLDEGLMDDHLHGATDALDHLLLGTADLERGIDWLEERVGVRAAAGGVHPGVGTRNALISLGGDRYLEIIAPDVEQTNFDFPIDFRSLAEPRLIQRTEYKFPFTQTRIHI